ncbi:hypothetical protein FEV13_03635 [Stutzerimonas degradans]|nr:hypothetical protein FEV13_03635 [Stutzerimonas degradans]
MKEAIDFWNANLANILVSLGVGLVFFVLGPIGVWFSGRKIRRERVRKAKELLIDLIEGMIVTQEKITTAKLKQLFSAVEREVEATIDADYDLERLFEDVSLRFQRSKHLDANQKDAYSAILISLTESIQKTDEAGVRVIPRNYKALFEELRSSVEEGNRDRSRIAIEELEEKISKIPQEMEPFFRIISFQIKMIRENPYVFVAVILIYFGIIGGLIASGVLK